MRLWDGLVVLVRVRVADLAHGDGDAGTGGGGWAYAHVFRGYVLGGRTLVGAWRHATASAHSVPFEGTFVVSKMAPLG